MWFWRISFFRSQKWDFSIPKRLFADEKWKKPIPNPFALVWAHADIILDEIRRYWWIFFLSIFPIPNAYFRSQIETVWDEEMVGCQKMFRNPKETCQKYSPTIFEHDRDILGASRATSVAWAIFDRFRSQNGKPRFIRSLYRFQKPYQSIATTKFLVYPKSPDKFRLFKIFPIPNEPIFMKIQIFGNVAIFFFCYVPHSTGFAL